MRSNIQRGRVAAIVPTLNGGRVWAKCMEALANQSLPDYSMLVIDSGSVDGTVRIAEKFGARVLRIPKVEFDHGGTRQLGVELSADAEIVAFLTHDAVLADAGALARLIDGFSDENVGAVFGRQLPRPQARPIEAHARLYNYPTVSRTTSLADVGRLGIKAAFLSNSFSAYRREALLAVGGFPEKLILGEDTVVAARLLLAGWKVGYRADALVYHSHDYTASQEFRRYFDTGVLHASERWLIDRLGSPEGEGKRFVRSEIGYLLETAPRDVLVALWRTAVKLAGYRLGRIERFLPASMKRHLSMRKDYWQEA